MQFSKISKLLVFIAIVFVFASCEDYLETKSNSKFTEESVFDNLDFATKQIYGIYENLTYGDLYDYNLLFFKCDNDIECSMSPNNGGAISLAHYAGDGGSSGIKQTWIKFYQTIERANIAIDILPKSKLWTGEYAESARRLYGEALTLRALCYYELVSLWGDVPFVTKSAQAGDNFYLPKTDRDEIYEFLINDLLEAQGYVPWMSDTKTAERVNKGFIKGLRARMALAYAGYSLRNKTFETKRGRHWEEYYKIANQETKELMESGKHRLNPNYEQIFKNVHAYMQDLQYGEILYEIAFGRLQSGRIAQTLGMQFSANPADPKYGRAAGEISTNLHYFYTFDRTDKRRNTNVELYSYFNTTYLGKQYPLSGNGTAFRPCKWRKNWITPSMGGDLKTVQFTGVNWPIMRYTDVVLMFAESENQINGPTTAAKDALISVRKRAFAEAAWQSKVVHYVDSVSQSKESFFNAIVDERAWEFGGEMIRKYDLVRWNLLGDRLDRMRTIVDNIVNHPNDPPYNFVPTYIYWKYKDDNETIEILNPDYRLNTTVTGYTKSAWISGMAASTVTRFFQYSNYIANGYNKTKNNHLFPIANDLIVASNGSLSNDQIP